MSSKFDEIKLNKIYDKLQDELLRFGRRYNLSITLGSLYIKELEARSKLSIKITDEEGLPLVYKQDFHKYAIQYGFNFNDFGKNFIHDEKTYRLIGLNSKSMSPALASYKNRYFRFTIIAVKDGMSAYEERQKLKHVNF